MFSFSQIDARFFSTSYFSTLPLFKRGLLEGQVPVVNMRVSVCVCFLSGDAGEKGIQGARGLKGASGQDGVDGQRGEMGPEGPKGTLQFSAVCPSHRHLFCHRGAEEKGKGVGG